jgi:hypothetical protein
MKTSTLVASTICGLLLFFTIAFLVFVYLFGWMPLAHLGLMSEWASSNRNVIFYGLVTDQSGTPVPGATVTLSIAKFDKRSIDSTSGGHFKRESFQMQTDELGQFSVERVVGKTLYIERVEHRDYISFPEPSDPTYMVFDYWSRSGGSVYTPIPSMPATFPLRKRDESRRLLPTRGGKDVNVP